MALAQTLGYVSGIYPLFIWFFKPNFTTTNMLLLYFYCVLRTLGPIQSILVLFSPLQLTSVQIGSNRSYSVHIGPIWSIMSTLVLFCPLRSYSIHLVFLVHYCPIRSTLVLFNPLCPLRSNLVLFGPILFTLVPFDPI